MKARRHSLSLRELLLVVTGAGVFLAVCKCLGSEPKLVLFTTLWLCVVAALLLGDKE